MIIEHEKIVFEQSAVKFDVAITKQENTQAIIPDVFAKVILLQSHAPSKNIIHDSYQSCQCRIEDNKDIMDIYSTLIVNGDWAAVSYQDEENIYDFSFHLKLPRNCFGNVRLKICTMLASSGSCITEFDSVIAMTVLPNPSLFVDCSDVSGLLSFLLHNSFDYAIKISSMLLTHDGKSKSLQMGSVFENEIGTEKSLCWSLDVNDLEQGVLCREKLTHGSSLTALRFTISWNVPFLDISHTSVYNMPLFEAFSVKLSSQPKLLTDEPLTVNRPFTVRYHIINNLSDFKNLTFKWNGPKSLYCLNPEENLGGITSRTEAECYLQFVPTVPGVFNVGGDSVTLKLQFSSSSWTKFYSEEVCKNDLYIEVKDES